MNFDVIVLVLILVGIIYAKWILISVLYILEALWGVYQRNKANRFYKFLAVSSVVSLHLLRVGVVDL